MTNSNTAKDILRDLIPPIVLKGLHKLKSESIDPKSNLEWEYIPEGWARLDRDANIKGWNVESVLAAYQANWLTFMENIDNTLPLGISPESGAQARTNLMFHNIMMTYGYALALASRHKSALSILDWGGGIGHYYPIGQKLLPDVEIDYHCKDVPVLAEYGQQLFSQAHFYSDDSCLQRKYDFVLASTSLHYSPDWQLTLKGLAEATDGHLLVTRLPIVHQVPGYVMVQRPYQYGYDTEYLGWCLNRGEFLDTAKDLGLKLVREFILQNSSFVHYAPEQPEYWGFLFTSS
jgi:putative methyltransferase (TIGR04325 family)